MKSERKDGESGIAYRRAALPSARAWRAQLRSLEAVHPWCGLWSAPAIAYGYSEWTGEPGAETLVSKVRGFCRGQEGDGAHLDRPELIQRSDI
jgi:hypothetical protein